MPRTVVPVSGRSWAPWPMREGLTLIDEKRQLVLGPPGAACPGQAVPRPMCTCCSLPPAFTISGTQAGRSTQYPPGYANHPEPLGLVQRTTERLDAGVAGPLAQPIPRRLVNSSGTTSSKVVPGLMSKPVLANSRRGPLSPVGEICNAADLGLLGSATTPRTTCRSSGGAEASM